MIDLQQPLDLDDPEAEAFLDGIQGNILRSHGRDFSAHLLLRMAGDAEAARRWITAFATERVTSAATALRQTRAFREYGGPGAPFALFALAPDGYRALGFTDAQLPTPDDRFNPSFGDRYFRLGMKGQATIVPRRANDPDVSAWEPPYRQQIHAMVLLADDDKARLDTSVAEVAASAAGVFDVLTVERGARLTQKFPRGELTIEHFGFQDGVSQPLMIKQDIDAEVARRGAEHWDPRAPLSLALLREPGGGLGSFLVFRKLEQDVKGFRDAVGDLANRTGADAEDLAAMAVGRRRDGTPLVPTTTLVDGADPNDFHYDLDPVGRQCPLFAHIRKTNPRGDVPRYIAPGTAEFERARRIVRRGITYGERPDLADPPVGDPPSTGVGLLFLCFGSNIDQFMIQQDGADSDHFVRSDVGVDAIIGQHPDPLPQRWFGTAFPMANFVTMKGGEYFFAPSMTFLAGLGRTEARP
ncbi:Dyp-type peroxidase [Pseudonocardia sp. CA-107938]|uniref:Dyp-type peroxidase n=1 Tax=Pseudonocardia sp. CA-107938 TaxID=3240021 RepID=UPI003D8A6BB1